MWNSAPRKSLISVFQEFYASINKIFINKICHVYKQ